MQCQLYNLLFNWYLLGVEMNLGHTHKTIKDSGTFYGCSRNLLTSNPNHFIGSTPRDLCLWIQSSSTTQLEAPTQKAQVLNDKKKTALQGTYPVDSKVANSTTGNVPFDTGLNDLVY